MREIKFRAWVKGQAMADWETITKECNRFTLLADSNFIFMQYTGLKDSTKWDQLTDQERQGWIDSGKTKEEWKGKEIYEGDLLQVEGESGNYNIFEVFYHDNDCIGGQNIGFCINRMHPQGNSAGGYGRKFTPDSIRDNNLIVCGNVHENPELIKEEQ